MSSNIRPLVERFPNESHFFGFQLEKLSVSLYSYVAGTFCWLMVQFATHVIGNRDRNKMTADPTVEIPHRTPDVACYAAGNDVVIVDDDEFNDVTSFGFRRCGSKPIRGRRSSHFCRHFSGDVAKQRKISASSLGLERAASSMNDLSVTDGSSVELKGTYYREIHRPNTLFESYCGAWMRDRPLSWMHRDKIIFSGIFPL